MKGTGLL